MLTNMKFENRPVHLFNIAGREYYVIRSNHSGSGAAQAISADAVAVVAPLGVSYQQAAMKAAQICLTL